MHWLKPVFENLVIEKLAWVIEGRDQVIDESDPLRDEKIRLRDEQLLDRVKQVAAYVEGAKHVVMAHDDAYRVRQTQLMREAKSKKDKLRQRDKLRKAEKAMQTVRRQWPTQAEDEYLDFLHGKAAKLLGISVRTLRRWLGGK